MTKDEALKLALDALSPDPYRSEWAVEEDKCKAITAIKEALAQPEQEPVAFINVEQRKLEWAKYMSWDTPTVVNLPKIPLYTIPPQRTWVGLMRGVRVDGDTVVISVKGGNNEARELCGALLMEKNT
jgi:hypothetical protein